MADDKKESGSGAAAADKELDKAIEASPLVLGGNEAVGLMSERGPTPVLSTIAPLVASPTGPVPVSVYAKTPEEADKIRDAFAARVAREEGKGAFEELTEEEVRAMPKAELFAVADARGYVKDGRRLSPEAFIRRQSEDKDLSEPKKAVKLESFADRRKRANEAREKERTARRSARKAAAKA